MENNDFEILDLDEFESNNINKTNSTVEIKKPETEVPVQNNTITQPTTSFVEEENTDNLETFINPTNEISLKEKNQFAGYNQIDNKYEEKVYVSKRDNSKGIGFVVGLFIILIIFVVMLPFIVKWLNI